MNYFDLKGKKINLGGLSSGKIEIDEFGKIDASRLFGVDNLPCFIIKESGGKAHVLQSKKSDIVSFPCFEKAAAKTAFPFCDFDFYNAAFPAKVNLCTFTPFIVLNDTDSGIPAVFFEFDVENITDEKVDFSIAALCQTPFERGKSFMGCSESGEAYVCISEDDKSICISTDEKNISFCQDIGSFADFEKKLLLGETLENTPCNDSAVGSAICAHLSLGKGEKHRVRFIFSWFLPQNHISRNYYTNYFESSIECSSYCFGHYDRLYNDSRNLCDLIFSSTLPENALREINDAFWSFSEKNISRLSGGALVSEEYEKFIDMDSFLNRSGILCSLFPKFEYSEVNYLYKNNLCDNGEILFGGDKNYERQLLLIIRSYRKYILSGDLEELIEEWYYIVKAFEYFCGEENPLRLDKNADGRISIISLQQHYSACLYAMSEMAQAVKDKKRYEKYSAMYQNMPMQEAIDFSVGFSKLCQYSGFSYDALKKHIGFSPLSSECPLDFGDTFRAPFFTPDGFGYVEEGIDYIEINMIKGNIGIRSFGVPRVPRMVQYGGRNWKFENIDGVAVLDSELEVSSSKKLTIFIDVKRK